MEDAPLVQRKQFNAMLSKNDAIHTACSAKSKMKIQILQASLS